MPPSLWFFRWGAVVTVVAGFGYYSMYILRADVTNANSDNAGASYIVVGRPIKDAPGRSGSLH